MMLNHPNSSLVKEMEYYIAPDELETDFLKITSPEEIKVCDPAAGLGILPIPSIFCMPSMKKQDMTLQAFQPDTENNLFGIELDQRAGELSARFDYEGTWKTSNILPQPIQPNICVLENIKFDADELNEYMERVGRDLFTFPFEPL